MAHPAGTLQGWISRLFPTRHRRAPLATGAGGNGHKQQPPKQDFFSDLVLINWTPYSLFSLPLIYALQLLLFLDPFIIKKHYASGIPIKPKWFTQKGRALNSTSGGWGPIGRRAESSGSWLLGRPGQLLRGAVSPGAAGWDLRQSVGQLTRQPSDSAILTPA